ncbi:MAG: penicillin-binding protein 2, partial [Gammaproteobacteria bacterium]|nr:penicillin-binding protein 2 [Gammaproteobacteria bacterium]
MARPVWLIKDPARERRLFRSRAVVAALLTVLLLLTILARAYYLQVTLHQHYSTLSTNNRVTLQPLTPTRGLIYDRTGTVLAENIPVFSLELIKEQIEDMDKTLAELQRLIAIGDEEIERFRKTIRRKSRFEPVPLRYRLSDEEVALISVNRHRLIGVEINSRLIRHYPHGKLTAHSVGYVGRINEQELKKLDPTRYVATTHIGKSNTERSHESQLHGEVGYQQVEVNARGRVLRVLNKQPPTPGDDIYLNLDIRLQQVASKAFGKRRGALVAIEPRSGAVITMVSVPSYDSNLFVNGISHKQYSQLTSSNNQPLFNRALQGQYPPGSTTKPFVGLAGLVYNQINAHDRIVCTGHYQLENDDHRYRDWKKKGHGEIGITRAIVESCDVFFYNLAFKLGIDRLSVFLKKFGFGQPTGFDIGGDRSGLMPSRAWKRRARNQPWYPGETLITGIGQGFVLATPLQMARSTATLATKGVEMQPQLIRSIDNRETGKQQLIKPRIDKVIEGIKESQWQRIHRAMQQVVHGFSGTARRISSGLDYKVAGKTGTSQVFGIKQDEEYNAEEIAERLRDHALFIAFAPVKSPEIAIAVIVENGGSGGAVAAPIAR